MRSPAGLLATGQTLRARGPAAMKPSALRIERLLAKVEAELACNAYAALCRCTSRTTICAGSMKPCGPRQRLAALALRYAVPTIYQYRPFAAAGGLQAHSQLSLPARSCPASSTMQTLVSLTDTSSPAK